MTEYTTRVLSVVVLPEGEPIFSEVATTVRIEDDAAGEYVVVEQNLDGLDKIAINPDEWCQLRAAIDDMVAKCVPSGAPK